MTDSVNHGGHGSDRVLRSAEALAKAAAPLSAEPSGKGYAAERRGDALEAGASISVRRSWMPVNRTCLTSALSYSCIVRRSRRWKFFEKGHRLFPRSTRLLLGLAASRYARGDYDRSARNHFEACDLYTGDPVPYMFLGKVRSIEITGLEGYVERLARFAKLHPDNAWANYYYAVALWKQRKGPEDSETAWRVANSG